MDKISLRITQTSCRRRRGGGREGQIITNMQTLTMVRENVSKPDESKKRKPKVKNSGKTQTVGNNKEKVQEKVKEKITKRKQKGERKKGQHKEKIK